MSFEADHLVYQRRLRRRIAAWRTMAVVFAALAAVLLAARAGWDLATAGSDHIARVEISGFISGNRDRLERLRRIVGDDRVRALVVVIDSPGGTTAGSEAYYEALRKVAGRKPVVAQMDTLATSGGYIAAMAADYIVARRNTITGSVGVLVQWADISSLLDSWGIDVETVRSGALKARPSPLEPTDEQTRAAMEDLVLSSYDWFIGLVAERRGEDVARTPEIRDGRIITGARALDLKLVDAVGGEDEVRTWLAEAHGLESDMPMRDWTGRSRFSGLTAGGTAAWLARAAGFDTVADALERAGRHRGGVDGLISVWHPQLIEK